MLDTMDGSNWPTVAFVGGALLGLALWFLLHRRIDARVPQERRALFSTVATFLCVPLCGLVMLAVGGTAPGFLCSIALFTCSATFFSTFGSRERLRKYGL